MNSTNNDSKERGQQQQHGLTPEEGEKIEEDVERLEGKPSTVEEEQGSPVSEVSIYIYVKSFRVCLWFQPADLVKRLCLIDPST